MNLKHILTIKQLLKGTKMTDKVIAPMQPPYIPSEVHIKTDNKDITLASTGSKVLIGGTFMFNEQDETDPMNLLNALIPSDWLKASFDTHHIYYILLSAESFMYKLVVHREDSNNIRAEWVRNENIPDDDGKPKELSLTYGINSGSVDYENSWLLQPLSFQTVNK